MFQKKANEGENLNEQAIKSNSQIWGCYVDLVHVLHIFLGGVKMVVVNIIMVTGMAMFIVEAFSYLIPALIEEFKNMED